jgi:hypothetical protein
MVFKYNKRQSFILNSLKVVAVSYMATGDHGSADVSIVFIFCCIFHYKQVLNEVSVMQYRWMERFTFMSAIKILFRVSEYYVHVFVDAFKRPLDNSSII